MCFVLAKGAYILLKVNFYAHIAFSGYFIFLLHAFPKFLWAFYIKNGF
jgi:hypothetical protein